MKTIRSVIVISLVLAFAAIVAPQARAASYVVNTTSDTNDGVCNASHCSLREALVLSFPDTGEADLISFNIPGAGPHTIRPTTQLPHVGAHVTIDGFTEPDFRRYPIVELDGSLITTGDPWGLIMARDHSIVRGLVVNRFHTGIRIDGAHNRVEGNFIGVNAVGLSALPNELAGVLVFGNSNTIGGTTHVTAGSPCNSPCNLISGNTEYGVDLAGANNASVLGNLIGTDRDGVLAIGNGTGIIASGSYSDIGRSDGGGNVVSGNNSAGVTVTRHAWGIPVENLVSGNRIGVNARGTAALPNGGTGVNMNNTLGTMVWNNQIAGNTGSGVWVLGTESGANWIRGNLIGTGPTGTTLIPNGGHGIVLLGGSYTFIGGEDPGEGNIIRGHSGFGIHLSANYTDPIQFAENTEIEGNTITENSVGIVIDFGQDTLVGGTEAGAGNVISGNSAHGMVISRLETQGTVIQGNYIGLAADGMTAQPNGNAGIMVHEQTDLQIGGTEAGAGNVISGNTVFGISLSNSTGLSVQGNLIGTNAAGTAAVPNSSGVFIMGGGEHLIGGTTAAARNVISGNSGQGIDIRYASTGNLIQGNFIGTDAAGTAPLGNGTGVQIQDSSDNQIGGSTAGAANLIAHNMRYGVNILESAGTLDLARGNLISQNAIFGTGAGVWGLGIGLGNDAVTPNDSNDPDVGPNRLQNFPALMGAVNDGTNTTVTGSLNSRPDTRYRIEFFSSAACDESGYGEGERYLGFVEVRTGGGGNASINLRTLPAVAAGNVISATATDISRSETSEFSACVEVTGSATAPIIAEIEALTDSIVKLGDAGVIKPSQEKTLIKLYTAAIKQLQKGKTEAALSKLGSAVNKLNAWVKSGKLDPQTGQMLIDQTNAIIEMINDPGKSSSGQ